MTHLLDQPEALAEKLAGMPVTGPHAGLRDVYGHPALVYPEPGAAARFIAILLDYIVDEHHSDPEMEGIGIEFYLEEGTHPLHEDTISVMVRYFRPDVPGGTTWSIDIVREAEDAFAIYMDPALVDDLVAALPRAGPLAEKGGWHE